MNGYPSPNTINNIRNEEKNMTNPAWSTARGRAIRGKSTEFEMGTKFDGLVGTGYNVKRWSIWAKNKFWCRHLYSRWIQRCPINRHSSNGSSNRVPRTNRPFQQMGPWSSRWNTHGSWITRFPSPNGNSDAVYGPK